MCVMSLVYDSIIQICPCEWSQCDNTDHFKHTTKGRGIIKLSPEGFDNVVAHCVQRRQAAHHKGNAGVDRLKMKMNVVGHSGDVCELGDTGFVH